MSKKLMGISAVIVALVAAACGGGTSPSGSQSTAPTVSPSGAAGSQLWVARYDGGGSGQPGKGFDQAAQVVISRDGTTAFVTGSSATVAYATATGARLWAVPSGGVSVAVSADGRAVFVTGTTGQDATADFATTAYAAVNGKKLWTVRYDGPAKRADNAAAVATSGDVVFVNGFSEGSGTGTDFATVAYAAATGKQLWVARYDGPNHRDEANFPTGRNTLAVSPDGAFIAVTGWSQTAGDGHDYATVAYDAATGKRMWVSRYHPTSPSDNIANAVTISPDSGSVFVTGGSGASMDGGLDCATVAYDAKTGAQTWVARYNGPGNRNDGGVAIVATSTAVIATGISEGKTVGHEDFLTIAYNPTTGKQLWLARYDGPAGTDDNAFALALSPDGHKVYVTGKSHTKPGTNVDYATVAYDSATGHQLWAARYIGNDANNEPAAIAVAVNGVVIVAGTSGGPTNDDYATLAYRG